MYVIIEGIDGCGKDTQAALLVDQLRREEGEPLLVAEPDEEMVAGKLLRQLLKSGENVESHAGLFLANRTALQTQIVRPALDRGDAVVSVRSFVSTLVYQQENWPLDWLFTIHAVLPARPNLMVLIDVPAEVGLERTLKRPGHAEHYERLETLQRVRTRYVSLFNPDTYLTGPKLRDFLIPGGQAVTIDGQQSIEEITKTVWQLYPARPARLLSWPRSSSRSWSTDP
jgi:dTMP kinase